MNLYYFNFTKKIFIWKCVKTHKIFGFSFTGYGLTKNQARRNATIRG